jgi:hypothetical protein
MNTTSPDVNIHKLALNIEAAVKEISLMEKELRTMKKDGILIPDKLNQLIDSSKKRLKRQRREVNRMICITDFQKGLERYKEFFSFTCWEPTPFAMVSREVIESTSLEVGELVFIIYPRDALSSEVPVEFGKGHFCLVVKWDFTDTHAIIEDSFTGRRFEVDKRYIYPKSTICNQIINLFTLQSCLAKEDLAQQTDTLWDAGGSIIRYGKLINDRRISAMCESFTKIK